MSLAKDLKRSGCRILKIGMESGDDTILKNMAKPCRIKDYQRAMEALVQHEISADVFFVIGFPGETMETLNQTAATINAFPKPHASLNHILFFPFILAPMAPVYDAADRKRFGVSGYMHEWSHKTMDSKEANALIPEMSGRITGLNPMHGNIEQMLSGNPKKLLTLDNFRGDFIRLRAKTGREDHALLEQITQTVKTFEFVEKGVADSNGQTRPFPRFM